MADIFIATIRYFALVSLVRDGVLGPEANFKKHFVEPIRKGQFLNASISERRVYKRRLAVLDRILSGVLHRRVPSEMEIFMQRRKEFVIKIRMTNLQRKLYNSILEAGGKWMTLWKILSLVWSAPKLLPRSKSFEQYSSALAPYMNQIRTQSIMNVIKSSGKIALCIELAGQCVLINEKLVIFCSSTRVLRLLMTCLTSVDFPTPRKRTDHPSTTTKSTSFVKFRCGEHVLSLQGSDNAEARDNIVTQFNSPSSDTVVLLVSLKV